MILDNLNMLAKSDIYPFHMPGHKRALDYPDPYSIDITEIEGFDNLHNAHDMILEAEKKASGLYGSNRAYYLVNGSTCGILASISAAVKKGGSILIARNCHRSVYHAVYLRQLSVDYIYPVYTKQGLQGQVLPEDIEKKLEDNAKIKAVVITSPTYDGYVSDIDKIAKIVHDHNALLIVDEAHGSHFGFNPEFPENAVRLGADAVIMSVHKTLPSFTQTALLHICSERISEQEVEKFLHIYETSSPSYILMSGIERCLDIIEKDGEHLFLQYVKNLNDFRRKTACMNHLSIITGKKSEFDQGKILIDTSGYMSGYELKRILRERFHIELEMAGINYATAMTSVMDTEDGFNRLSEALCKIDNDIKEDKNNTLKVIDPKSLYRPGHKIMEIYEAYDQTKVVRQFEKAIGDTSAEFISLYPPGIPIVVPGEKIDEEIASNIMNCSRLGYEVDGVEKENNDLLVPVLE